MEEAREVFGTVKYEELIMKIRELTNFFFAVLILMVSVSSAIAQAQTQSSSTAMNEAGALFQAQKWGEAAKAYEAITKSDPTNARAWFQLGWSRHGLAQYDQAIDAFQKALEINKGTARASFAMYAIGVMYAEMKDKD